MKKAEKISLLLGVLVIILLAVAIVWNADVIGVSENKLVEDARESQGIEADWEVAQAVNEDMCAMLFYDEAKHDCTYSIYLSRDKGVSGGYFFSQGGKDAYMTEDVKAMIFEGRGIAVMSLNANGVCKIVTSNRTIQVDPEKPFAVLFPIDCGAITLYDEGENIVTLYDTYTG